MARASGEFLYKFDPDEATPLPRPWHLGEGKKGQDAFYPRGTAPAKDKTPSMKDAKGDAFKKYNLLVNKMPHVAKNVKKNPNAIGMEEWDNAFARQMTGKKGQGGVYLKVQTGTKFEWQTRRYVPTYKYVKVDPTVAAMILSPEKWDDDPNKLQLALRFLYRNGFMKSYRRMVNLMRTYAARINDAITQQELDWETEYKAWAAKQKAAVTKYNRHWIVS